MTEHWIIPSNPSTFDTSLAFESLREINWSEVGDSSIASGDIVYLYSSSPNSMITHKCIVVATRVATGDLVDDSAFWLDPAGLAERIKNRSWMRLRLLSAFDLKVRAQLGLHTLQDHGLRGTMSGRQRLQKNVLAYIQGTENDISNPNTRFWWVNQGTTGVTMNRSSGTPNLWAAFKDTQGNSQPSWDSLDEAKPGDVVLHYANGFLVGSSRVQRQSRAVIRPPEFETIERWGDGGRELLLEAFALFDIPVRLNEVPIELRRSKRGSGGPFTTEGNVQRGFFFPIHTSIASAVFAAASLVLDRDEPEEMVGGGEASERYLLIDETDGTATVRYRKEQGALRKRLFGSASQARCGICGRRYPVKYLHTAHVKSRKACSEEERKDWKNVVIAACLFGCDALFEGGMLTVDSTGMIHINEGQDETPAFRAFTTNLAGKVAIGFTTANRQYFEWRNLQGRSNGSD